LKTNKTNHPDFKYSDNKIISSEADSSIAIDKVVREMHFTEPNELAIASYFYEPSSKFQDKDFKGNVSGTYAFASQAIEVEIDTYTGNVKVLHIYVAQDVGKVLNPLLLGGQI